MMGGWPSESYGLNQERAGNVEEDSRRVRRVEWLMVSKAAMRSSRMRMLHITNSASSPESLCLLASQGPLDPAGSEAGPDSCPLFPCPCFLHPGLLPQCLLLQVPGLIGPVSFAEPPAYWASCHGPADAPPLYLHLFHGSWLSGSWSMPTTHYS